MAHIRLIMRFFNFFEFIIDVWMKNCVPGQSAIILIDRGEQQLVFISHGLLELDWIVSFHLNTLRIFLVIQLRLL